MLSENVPSTNADVSLTEIAARITDHLRRVEDAQPSEPLPGSAAYRQPGAEVAGDKVAVTYIADHDRHLLGKGDALDYLHWLDAGNSGRHHGVIEYKQR